MQLKIDALKEAAAWPGACRRTPDPGDIAAGIAASLVARRLAQGTGRRAALWFNAFGMTDLVVSPDPSAPSQDCG